MTLYDFSPGGRYGGSDVDFQAQIREELLLRDRHRFTGVSMVVGMRPGVVFQLTDHPVPGIDGRYIIMKVRHISSPPPHAGHEGHEDGEQYHNEFECISADQTPYDPERSTPKPAIYSVQTAVVTGPNPGEPYTDEYGRIKVRFHWDHHASPDPTRTSAWVRLAQTWAGHDGSGLHTFLFIPRVGSEVVVTFLDGNPDRPLVTGAVYNAQNLPPLSLPGEASRSVIRTESIGGGGGFNELSFEDASGKEEVYLHAQRNLRERVLNDHTTHVGHDHTNTVDNDDTELVKGNQELTVKKDRTKTVDGNETITVDKNRKTTIGVDDTLHVKNDSHTTIDNNKTLDVLGNYNAKVIGAQTWTIDGGSTLTVTGGITQTINSGGWTMTTTGNVSHSITGSMSMDTSAGFSVDATRGRKPHRTEHRPQRGPTRSRGPHQAGSSS